MLLKKCVGFLNVLRIEESTLGPIKQTRANLASKEITNLVAGDSCDKSDESDDW